MGLLAAKSSVVVISDFSINGDPHIGEVLHKTVGLGLPDHKAALLDRGSARRVFRECLDEPAHEFDVPAGISAGLLQEGRVVPIEPQQFLGKVIFSEILYFQLDALPAIQVGEEDGELLACPQLDLAPLAGQRVCCVHPDHAADPVQSLAVIGSALCGLGDDIGSVAPGNLAACAAFVEGDIRLRAGQRGAVVDFFGGACVDRKGSGNYQKSAAHSLNVCKMTGDIFTRIVVDGVVGDRVLALAGVRPAAPGTGLNGEDGREAVDQDVRGAGQRLSVIVFTCALCHKGDGAVPGPITVCGVDPRAARGINIVHNITCVLYAV